MLGKKTCDFMLFGVVSKRTKCWLRSRKASTKDTKKKEKSKKWIMRKMEDQILFGKLLETKKEKTQRVKLEEDGKISKPLPSLLNSELTYITPFANLKIIKRSSEQKINDKINLDSADETKKEAKAIIHKKSDISHEKDLDLMLRQDKEAMPLLSKIIVQKLLEFPLFQECKSFDSKWTDSSEIMSLPSKENGLYLKYPSVTKILSSTMSETAKAILEKWKMRMIEKLGLRGFEIYQAELFEDGKELHLAIMNTLYKKPYKISDKIKQSFSSLSDVFKNVDNVRALESHVIHPVLKYRGIVDCIANYRGDVCLIDWKKSDKEKNTIGSTYDAPFQLASYIGALNADFKYPFQIKKGLIVVAYTNGRPATVHEVSAENLQLYWKIWLQRLQDYHIALNMT
ncbi:PREDICTED: mitochondrial genome maintenance exonuclease 1-like [Ceratosolen solmsi marchali]|uniref:Mitochondrial genome maintenance exonuclease 1 n=1 Tax=Ceratosolen solmsi marchali TaxID=326594 RepID=A0AAJ7DWN5_9HYME|nr:PREDICTED: mitochondrial genome maintenance exonuclease 1-like [Ceratosolen solmsi marchali]